MQLQRKKEKKKEAFRAGLIIITANCSCPPHNFIFGHFARRSQAEEAQGAVNICFLYLAC